MTKQYENEVSSVAFEWCRCRSQSIVILHFYSQLVLPPYTVKIRGGRLGRIIEMSSCPATQYN